MLVLKPTKEFSVYDLEGDETQHRSALSYQLQGPLSKNLLLESKRSFQKHGFCVFKDLFTPERLRSTWSVVSKLSRHLIASYDSVADEFVDIDQDELCITRMPRIGRGKHNIHFDPQFSPQHEALATMVKEGGILDLLTNYLGKQFSLRETGFTMTRPMVPEVLEEKEAVTEDERELYHGGMEWHSDGALGEVTMLITFTGIKESMGPVRIMPGSHMDYVEGIGHTEEILKQRKEELEANLVQYVYEPATPLVFDSRTLHSVSNNYSDEWRILIWFIYDCY
eukprot:gene2142-2336_t